MLRENFIKARCLGRSLGEICDCREQNENVKQLFHQDPGWKIAFAPFSPVLSALAMGIFLANHGFAPPEAFVMLVFSIVAERRAGARRMYNAAFPLFACLP
ncbi:hypothetical protein [Azonexus sp.]|uniref:hypothetical protein n=1 Tax=Azonexus sp. TaxID=1872668 RepID=UPI0027B9865E|nr:hypothetical protein [Azonexus sp.]